MSTDTVLEAVGASRTYGSGSSAHHAVRPLDLVVDSGTRLGIVGESGSGKSTLARMLVGLEHPTAGSIRWRGLALAGLGRSDRAAFRRAVQLVAQDTSASFDPRRTLRDAVRRPAELLLGLDRPAADRLVDQTLELLDVPVALADRRAHEVSGGQRQRFSIARALVVRPRLLVCDEVVSALDVSVQGSVLNFLRRYCADHRAGLVFVSHGLPATAFVAEQLLVMRGGEVLESGSTGTLLSGGAHPYTRALVQAYRGPAADATSSADQTAGTRQVMAR